MQLTYTQEQFKALKQQVVNKHQQLVSSEEKYLELKKEAKDLTDRMYKFINEHYSWYTAMFHNKDWFYWQQRFERDRTKNEHIIYEHYYHICGYKVICPDYISLREKAFEVVDFPRPPYENVTLEHKELKAIYTYLNLEEL